MRKILMVAMVVLFMLSTLLSAMTVAAITVTVTSPRANEVVGGSVQVKGTSSGASSVELRIDEETTWRTATGNATWNYTWNASGYSKGYHNMTARAKAGAGFSDLKTVQVYVDNTPPDEIIIDASATPLEIAPADNVTVSGFVTYDNGVILKGIPVKVQVVSTSVQSTVNTTDTGYFIIKISGPSEANKYTLRVSVTDGNLTGKKDFQLTVTTPTQPDLVLKSVQLDPVQPRHDDTVSICATVENLGEDPASALVKFYVDGAFQDQQSVQVDTSVVAKSIWIATVGTHTIKVVADNVNPADKDSSNNQLSIKMTIPTEPDVKLEAFVLSNPSPRDGDGVTIMVKIKNTGFTGATGSVVIYDGDPASTSPVASKGAVVNSNGTSTLYMTWTATKGQHTLTARVLVDGQPLEQKHSMSKDVTVLEAKKPNKPVPGMGSAAVLLALVVVTLLAGRRACR